MALMNQDPNAPPAQMEGGETFMQRMKRMNGQNQSATAGIPQSTGMQTSPYEAPKASTPPPADVHAAVTGSGAGMASASAAPSMGGSPSSPVSGDGKIPAPSAPIMGGGMAGSGGPPVAQTATGGGMAGGATAPPPTGHPPAPTSPPPHNPPPPAPHGDPPPTAPGGPTSPPPPPAPPAGPSGPPKRPENTNLGAYDLGNNQFSTYQGTQFTGETPQGYQGGQISQFSGPDQSRLEGGQADLAQAILGNPESFSPEMVSGLKNAQKEEALLQAKQMQMRNANSAAARGISGGGGQQANDRRLYDQADSQILKANRDIEGQAAQANFGNRLQALDSVNNILNSQMGRASTAYGNTLQGQTAQEGVNQASADSRLRTSQFDLARQGQQADENFRAFGTRASAEDKDLQRKLSQFDINKAVAGHGLENYKTDSANYFGERDANRGDRGLDIQKALGEGGLAMDRARLSSSDRQFDKSYGLNLMQFMEGKRQADNNLGYNYTSLGQQGQNGLMDKILGLLGGG